MATKNEKAPEAVVEATGPVQVDYTESKPVEVKEATIASEYELTAGLVQVNYE